MSQHIMRRALTKLNPEISCFGRSTNTVPSFQIQCQRRSMGTGPRGARGHGWLHKYRSGLGGRHLQGRYHKRDVEKLSSINDAVFSMNESHKSQVTTPTHAYLDFNFYFGGDGRQVEGENTTNTTSGEKKETHRVIIELASAALPNTCRNFVDLCNGSGSGSGSDSDSDSGEIAGYKSSKVFKILPQVGLCLGDTTVMNNGEQGKCSPSVNGSSNANANANGQFAHESTVLSHSQSGIVTMLSSGLDKNDSRFMIVTADDAPHLDGKFVAFGRVKEGLDGLQDLVKNTYTKRGLPTTDIQVVGCGTL